MPHGYMNRAVREGAGGARWPGARERKDESVGSHDNAARVVGPARLIEIRPGRLRELMAQEERLSELILRALLRRRVFMIGLRAGVSIIGSSYSADARRLLEFTARNQIPRSWVDVEARRRR